MKKTILLVVLGVITVFCIIFGTAKHLGGSLSLGDIPFIHIGGGDEGDFEESDNHNGSIDETLEAFSSIKINATVMEIRIEEGSQFKIESNYTKSWLEPNFAVRNGELEVTQRKKKNSFNGGNNNCKFILTVPKGTKLYDVDIQSNVGDITLSELDTEKIDIDVNVGEVAVRDVDFNIIEVETNVGEVSVNPNESLENFEISLSADVGEVRVDGKSYKRNYNQRGSTDKKIKISTNVGQINL